MNAAAFCGEFPQNVAVPRRLPIGDRQEAKCIFDRICAQLADTVKGSGVLAEMYAILDFFMFGPFLAGPNCWIKQEEIARKVISKANRHKLKFSLRTIRRRMKDFDRMGIFVSKRGRTKGRTTKCYWLNGYGWPPSELETRSLKLVSSTPRKPPQPAEPPDVRPNFKAAKVTGVIKPLVSSAIDSSATANSNKNPVVNQLLERGVWPHVAPKLAALRTPEEAGILFAYLDECKRLEKIDFEGAYTRQVFENPSGGIFKYWSRSRRLRIEPSPEAARKAQEEAWTISGCYDLIADRGSRPEDVEWAKKYLEERNLRY